MGGGGQKNIPAWKVHRQYTLVLLVERYVSEGKAMGSDKGKGLRIKERSWAGALLLLMGILVLMLEVRAL